ncbi:hypothetical protein VSVS12_04190 [Vibrio scophthalmi]|uniref:hypothetical protein n=1 Tax=Vibrio scophthalmi TaxID=45658 RepID=UPI0008092624|nr:hypothetical protein [Vibrio scophthalmi]ANS87890.1 hypothetical protein VSVS12_04190 [Vibrio scophthalmi]
MFGDRNFSWVTIAFWGIIETTGVGDFDVTKCIELVNEIMTVAKLSDESLRVFMLDEHNLYEFRMTQYSPDGNIIRVHQPVSQLTTLFGLANDDESVHTRQEAKDSSQIISQLKNNTLQIYDRLYASALIDKGNNNYTSSFYQLNSSIESLITHSLREVYLHINKIREFEVFMYGDNDRVPSNYAQLKELRKQVNLISQGVISNKDRNQLEEYLNIVKGKNGTGVLRNRLVHGSEHTVNKETLFRSFDAYKSFKVTLESKLRQVI